MFDVFQEQEVGTVLSSLFSGGACLAGVSREGIRFELGFEGCVGHAWAWGAVSGKGRFGGGSLLLTGTAVWPRSPGGAVETRCPAAGGLCLISGVVLEVWPLGGTWGCSPKQVLGFGCSWASGSFC